MPPTLGWGTGPYGGGPWGGGPGEGGILLVLAEAIADNRIRFKTSLPLVFSGVRDARDASVAAQWVVTAVGDARAVKVVSAHNPIPEFNDLDGDPSFYVDVTLDRAMDPHPAQYAFVAGAVGPLPSKDGSDVLENVEGLLYGLHSERIVDPSEQATTAGRDLAMFNPNPDSAAAGLGSYLPDATGDYAFDRGRVGLKKRCFRRLFTKKSAFVHLPGYGASVTQLACKLARAGTMASLEADCISQLLSEPDVEKVDVTISTVDLAKGLFRMEVNVTPKGGVGQRFFASFRSRP